MADDRTLQRFIPYPKVELVELLCAEGALAPDDRERFRVFCRVLAGLYHFQFHEKLEALKAAYHPFNPDLDTLTTRTYAPADLEAHEKRLVALFSEVLSDANFEQITEADLQSALREESAFAIRLRIHFDDFAEHLIFWRGTSVRKATVRRRLLWKTEVDVPVFDRVALLIKFKDADHFRGRNAKGLQFEPGSMVLKLFKNIPRADLEMLFPNTEVLMRLRDKLLLGVPGVAGGIGMLVKAGATIAGGIGVGLLVVRSFFSSDPPRYPDSKEMALMIAALIGLGSLGGYLWRQWGAYKNRRLSFMKALTDNLYFRNLDNNAGVFCHVIDSAEEEECKEAMLAYRFLLASPGGLTEGALDDRIEEWFRATGKVEINFEVGDALRKLKALGLCAASADADPVYTAPPLEAACARLDEIWDGLFTFPKGDLPSTA